MTHHLVTYLLAVLVFVAIPGPATMLTIARSAALGVPVGLVTAVGIACGDLFHASLTVVGVAALVAASPWLLDLVKSAGAAYLLWLGLRTLVTTHVGRKARVTMSDADLWHAFGQAVLIEILNPKTALFFLSFLPQFVDASYGDVRTQLAVLALVFVSASLGSTAIFALAAGKLAFRLRGDGASGRWGARLAGSVYLLLGMRLLLQVR